MLLRWFEHSRVYHPTRRLEASGAEMGRPFEDVLFKTSDGIELNGWFFPANVDSVRGRIVFLNCHGNGGNISHRLGLYRALLEIGAAVFTFDYRGYGKSHGRPSEEGTYLDVQAAYHWLPVRWMGRIKYDTRSKLPRLKIPVLVMHSRDDGLIGFRHSERNFDVANEPKFSAELRGGHNDPAWEAPEFEEAIEKFLKSVENQIVERR